MASLPKYFARDSALALQILALTASYYVTGKLGTSLAIPPGYATAIWPPSGIALAGILMFGYRVWPGILLGSFLVNLSTTLAAGSTPETLVSVIVTLTIGSGAALQAVVGGYLLRRFADFPNPLSNEKEVFLFLLFGGILGSLVNSTISVSTLAIADRIPWVNFPANWGTWWMGDALGVFIFTPLVLVWGQHASEFWRNRRMAMTLPIIVMFVLTTVAVFYEAKNNSERLKLEFDQQALALKVALDASISNHINALYALESFYSASKTIDREGFRTFVTRLLDNLPGIQALEWNPIIPFSERKAFERKIQSEGYRNFQITEQNADKQMVAAKNRPVYVPVDFIEPYEGNEAALGYDVYSDRLRHEAIDRARDSGAIATTSQITLIQELEHQYGVLTFMPIYRNDLPHKTPEERRRNIAGYMAAVFRGKDIVTAALKDINRDRLSYRLIDESASAAEQLIFSSDRKELKALSLQEKGLFGRNLSFINRSTMTVGGRQWRFEVTPTQEYLAAHSANNAWLILLSGLMLTSIVGAFAMVSSGRGRHLRRLVDERTAALAESEGRFRSIFESAPVGVANVSLDGHFIEVNQGYCDLVGYSRDELLGMTIKQVTPPDYHQSDAAMINKALAGEIHGFNREKQYLRKDGELVWGNLSSKLIRHADGSPDHFVAVIENIDSRKRAELSLHKESEKNLALLRNASDGIHILDSDGNIIEVSDSFCAMLGYRRDEMIGMNVGQWDAHYSEAECLQLIRQQLATRLRSLFETRHRRKDGSFIDVEVSGSPLELDGKPALFNSSRDITARKQAQLQLQESEQRFRIVADVAPVLIWLADTDKRRTWFNQVWLDFTGRSMAQEYGNGWADSVHPDDLDRYLDSYVRCFDRREPFRMEYRLKRNDGEYRWIDGHGVPLFDAEGTFTGYIGSCLDITDMRQAKEAAEGLAQSKSEFLANMSHEIRTPMNAIIGLSQLAMNKEISAEIRDYLEKIYSSSNSLLGILNDVLDFSKLEAGRLTIDHSLFNIDVMLDNIRNVFVERAKEKHIGFKMDIAPDVPRDLVGDALRLQQVLINLLGNAIKFTERGEVAFKITVSQIDQSQARLLFCVTDTGIGMSAHDLDKLFQPFSQVDGSITRRFGGTGLGLAISHNLLQLMGSEFSVESSPGKGSRFSFELALEVSPLSGRHKADITFIPIEEDLGKLLIGTRILVAEDNPVNQQVVREFLNLSGIIVEMANNGKEAIVLLENNVFDAVLMDIHMPEMDGFAATKLIRRQARFAGLPVIALTAGVTKEERERCKAAGMNDFIAKPISPKRLLSTLVKWIKPAGSMVRDAFAAEAIAKPRLSADELPDFDLHNLLVMLGNNRRLATQLLLDFMDSMKDLPEEIEAMIRVSDFDVAGELVHKIKGASGNIGAVRLHVASETLEAELKQGRAAALSLFLEAFKQAMSVIAALPRSEEQMPSSSGDIDALKRAAAELDVLLKENDFISEVLLNTLKPHLAPDQLDLFAQLRKLVNGLQYGEARKVLRQLAELPDASG